MVAALAEGSRVADRFEIGGVIGRGGFSIVYDVLDLRRGDQAVLKELVTGDARRGEDGVLDLGPSAATLRRTFLAEAQTVGRLTAPGILPVRLAFVAGGTACVVTDSVPGATTLDAVIREQGPLHPDGVLDLAYQLMETLEAVHAAGVLHRDVKPSNVLVGPDGKAYLIDFGAARAWTADALDRHTVVFTPGFAPPEQHVAVAKRGPESDVYGLCATLYAALTGVPPTDATARAGGAPLVPLPEGLEPGLVRAIGAGLALRASERPASMAELRRLLELGGGGAALETLESLDALLLRSQRFAFDRRSCPACAGVLEEARPLGRDACPVCRRGRVRPRRLDPRVCPICRHGILRRPKTAWRTPATGDALTCDACHARLVPQSDGRWCHETGSKCLYPAEWSRLAAGLDPGAGNAFCDACDADFAREGDRLTLLAAEEDPHGFASAYRGRSLPQDRVRWIAVGKQSPHPGLVCDRCDTEFDHTGRLLTLVQSPNRRLDRLAGETRSLDSWHRVAEALPEAGREAELEDRISAALATAYRRGEVGFGGDAWRGSATYEGRTVPMVARDDLLRLGRGLRVRTLRFADLRDLRAEGDWIIAEGPEMPFEMQVEPVELVAHLRSGDRAVLLTATDLAARLTWAEHTRDRFRLP